MTDKAISPLRRRLIEDMTIRRLSPNTQHQYIRHVKSFADFVGRSPDKTTAEDVHRSLLLSSLDSPQEGRVYCELVSKNGIVGAWRMTADFRGFLDDKRA